MGFRGLEGSVESLFKDRDQENSQGGEREREREREREAGGVGEKRITFELYWGECCLDGGGDEWFWGISLWGVVLGESGEWLLAVVKMEILLWVPAMHFVVLFLKWGWVEYILSWLDFHSYLFFFWGWLLFPFLKAVLPLWFSFSFFGVCMCVQEMEFVRSLKIQLLLVLPLLLFLLLFLLL